MSRAIQTLVLTAAFYCSTFSNLHSQIVQSYCSGPTSLQHQYIEDAWYVAFDYQMKSDSATMMLTVPISPQTKDSVLACILGVYNANLPARDSVFDLYNIHDYKDFNLREMELFLDTTHAWTKALIAGNTTTTGNFYVDSLATLYGFTVTDVQYLPEWVEDFDAIVRIKTAIYANTDYLADIMRTFTGVNFANPVTYGGDGNRIYYNRKSDHAELTFRRGWEDCPSGCILHRDWLFRVFDDCKVEFVASYGDPVNTTPVSTPINAANVNVFPNPITDNLSFELNSIEGNHLTAQLINTAGQNVFTGQFSIENNLAVQNIDVRHLPNGIYFLSLSTENQYIAQKVMIQK